MAAAKGWLVFWLPIIAALTVGGGEVPVPLSRMGTVQTIERLVLPSRTGPVSLEVDALGARVTVSSRKNGDGKALLKAFQPQLGRLCTKLDLVGEAVVFTCGTNRLDAVLTTDGGKRYLDLHELRGLPWRGPEHAIDFPYDPAALRVGGPCPGTTPVAQGECALQAGNVVEAALQFRLALATEWRSMGALRLGDIAIRNGDVATAASWYQRAIGTSIFGRMGRAKLCELNGDCFSASRQIMDPVGMPEPLRTELLLRAARIDAFLGRPADAAKKIATILPPVGRTGACMETGRLFCRRLLLAAVEGIKGRDDQGIATMEIYLSLPDRAEGVLSLALSRAAGEAAARMGAPVFAGNLLSAATPQVPEEQLTPHLLRTADLYMLGQDRARARLIVEFAETRLPPREMSSRRWAQLRRESRRTASEPSADDKVMSELELMLTEGVADLAAAYGALVKSRLEAR